MDNQPKAAERFLRRVKGRGGEVSRPINQEEKTHFRSTTRAWETDLSFLNGKPAGRRFTSAGRGEDLGPARSPGRLGLEKLFERNRAFLAGYLGALERGGLSLPENPMRGGEVFYPQVEAESGLPRNSLAARQADVGDDNAIHLRGLIDGAVPGLGVELRVLPRLPSKPPSPLTYERLLERGTEARMRELLGKGSQRQQLYNTRCALRQFVERSGLGKTAVVGDKFAADFDAAVGEVAATFKSEGTLKKFLTEVQWWQNYYRGLLKEQAMPPEFRGALAHLVEGSGLPLLMVARLSHLTGDTLKAWYEGARTPAASSYDAVARIEKLFKLPAGTLVNKLSSRGRGGRFSRARLPEFLRSNTNLAHRVNPHLPDDFCGLPLDRQIEIVESIRVEVLRGDDPFTLKIMEISKLPYRLKDWPQSLTEEFEDLAAFKTAPGPPLGMRRNCKWRQTTAEKLRRELARVFGAFRLPADAEDVRLRGLGIPVPHLTLAMLACPLMLDWFVRFWAARRGQYTKGGTTLLENINGMLRAGTGWLRQRPGLASKLTPVSCGGIEFVSQELAIRALADWEGMCDDAYRYYKNLIKDLKPLLTAGRDPFVRIEGIVEMESPMRALEMLLEGMRNCLPNKVTQPARYHTSIRDSAIVALFTVTGLRRTTLSLLDYGGGTTGHLSRQGGAYELRIPRALFKEEDSPFFGPKHAPKDYFMILPDVFGLYALLDEYLGASRPWLLGRFHEGVDERALFVTTGTGKYVRVVPVLMSEIYKTAVKLHLVENRWRGTGIRGVRPHGPHSVRHIRGTEAVKRTGSFQTAADANHNSEAMARRNYTRFLPADRNRRVNEIFFKSKKDEDEDEDE
jgi:hypothetical protein